MNKCFQSCCFPLVSLANTLACKGLDKIEKTLPILHKPSDEVFYINMLAIKICSLFYLLLKTMIFIIMLVLFQIAANAREAVTGARETVTGTMNGAKETVSHKLSGVMDRTREAMQDSVEKTKTVVSGGVQTVMESKVVKLVSSGVDTALSTSETLLEQYLPETEEEKGET